MLPFELTKDTPYLALSGELWSVFYEYFNKNWPCYKGFLLYFWYLCDKHLKHCRNNTLLEIKLYVDEIISPSRMFNVTLINHFDSKVYGVNMGPTWGR